jgi:hypothetical protein
VGVELCNSRTVSEPISVLDYTLNYDFNGYFGSDDGICLKGVFYSIDPIEYVVQSVVYADSGNHGGSARSDSVLAPKLTGFVGVSGITHKADFSSANCGKFSSWIESVNSFYFSEYRMFS